MGAIVWFISTIFMLGFGVLQILAAPAVMAKKPDYFEWWVLLYALIPLAVWNIGARTNVGREKFGRVVIGFAAFFNWFGIGAHVLVSLTTAVFYYKILSITTVGVTAQQKMGMAGGFVGFSLLVWFVIGVFLGRYFFGTPDIMDGYLALEPFSLNIDRKKLKNIGIQVSFPEKGLLGKLFAEKAPLKDGLIEGPGDLVIGKDKQTRKPAIITASDLTMNVGIFGSIGSGKTQGELFPMAYQHLRNMQIGAIVMEPKGTWLRSVPRPNGEYGVGLYEVCRRYDRETYFVNPHDPNTDCFNFMMGHPDIAAESARIALRSLFGDQEGFFDEAQGLVLVQIIRLLKYLAGDKCDFNDVGRMLREPNKLFNNVQILKARLQRAGITDPNDDRNVLVTWYENKYYGDQEKEFQSYTMGLQIQVERLLANQFFKRCIIPDKTNPNQRIIDLDKHLQSINWLLINTDDGLLGDYSKVLARLLLVPLMYAVQRRFNFAASPRLHPIYIDELGTYIYKEFATFATKSREYNCPLITAFQSLGQLMDVGGVTNPKAFHDNMLGTLNNKIICSRLVHADVQYFSKSLGTVKEMVKTYSSNVSGKVTSLMPERSGKNEMYREQDVEAYKINDIKFMEPNEVIYETLQNRKLMPARVATTSMVDPSLMPDPRPEDLEKARITAVMQSADDFVVPRLENEAEMAKTIAMQREMSKKKDTDFKSPVQGKKPAVQNKGANVSQDQSATISPNYQKRHTSGKSSPGDDLMGK